MQLLDYTGVISRETVNTMERFKVAYNWSVSSPSDISEVMQAQEAQSNFRKIMTQMISGNWEANLQGFWIGPPTLGYQSKRIRVSDGKQRYVLEPDPIEGEWFKRMFKNRIEGISDEKSVIEINKLGFKSRTQRLKSGGVRGGVKLKVKQLKDYIENPIYAGIMIRKMTHSKPVKGTRWTPIVSVDDWNKANEGKKKILEFDGEIRIIKRQPEVWRLTKQRDNPEFPYKWVLCPKCKKPLYGSASTVPGEKRRNPAYHCTTRGHNFRVKKLTFDATITSFIRKMKFNDNILLHLKKQLIDDHEKERIELKKDSISLQDRVIQIGAEQLQLAQSIGKTSLLPVIKQLEVEYQKLEDEKAEIMANRNKKEQEELDINGIIKKVWHFLHSFEDGLLGQANPIERSLALKSCFKEMPTYEDLEHAVEYNTAESIKLKRHIELIPSVKTVEELSAPPEGQYTLLA